MKKTNTLPISPVRKALFFFCTECGVYFLNVSLLTKVIFFPTHKYKRLYTEKSSPHVYADILNFRTKFVIFEQFFIHPERNHKNPSLYKEGFVFRLCSVSIRTEPPIFVYTNCPEVPLSANINTGTEPLMVMSLQRKS